MKPNEMKPNLFPASSTISEEEGVRFVRKIRSVTEKKATFYLCIQLSKKKRDPALYTTYTNNPKTKKV